MTIIVATANILTLQQPSATQPGSGTSITRQTLLMQQFHAKGCHIVGVQETRHKHIGGSNKWYHILGHSATSQGTDGVQLWISKLLPLCHHGAPISRSNIKVVASRHDYIVAKLHTNEWKCAIVTGRAPHAGRPLSEARDYWMAITNALHRKAAGWPVLYCGDSNAHLGESTTSAVGSLHPSQENQAGAVFHEWLLQQRLLVPATFATMHQGDSHSTYQAPGGDLCTRIDYVAVPQELNYQTVTSWVDLDVDPSIQRTDHLAAMCNCTFGVMTRPKKFVASPTRWDSHHLQQQLQHEDVFHLHDELYFMPWHVDPHSSATWLTNNVIRALHGTARHRKHWQRKSHISTSTWDLVDAKKQHYEELRSLNRTRLYTILHACFHSWREQIPGSGSTRMALSS